MTTARAPRRPMLRALVGIALVGPVLLQGCASVEPGNGRPAAADGAEETSGGDDATPTTDPTATTTESTSETATETATETTDPGQPTGSEDPALAFAIGFQFAAHVNTENLQLAYELLCADVQAVVTLEDFSDGAPEPGTLSFDPGEQLGPGSFSGTLTYGEESGDVLIRSDGAGGYCLSEE